MRSADEAAAYARHRAGSGEVMAASGYCLQMTRECYPVDAYYFSAVDAGQGAVYQFPAGTPEGDSPPVGTPVYWLSSNPYRHVAIYVGVGGSGRREVVTVWDEHIKVIAWDDMPRTFGPYAGWTADLNRVTVWSPASSTREEDDMRMIQRGTASGTVTLIGSGCVTPEGEPAPYLVLGKYAVPIWQGILGSNPQVIPADDYDAALAHLKQGFVTAP